MIDITLVRRDDGASDWRMSWLPTVPSDVHCSQHLAVLSNVWPERIEAFVDILRVPSLDTIDYSVLQPSIAPLVNTPPATYLHTP